MEGSIVDKYEAVADNALPGTVPHNTGYSVRTALGYAGFRLSGE